MSDDWLLKDKIINMSNTPYKILDKIVCINDIETLRQLLIEDVSKLFPFVPVDDKFISLTGIKIKDIINKRFGVDK